jgi:hypothetical protein
MYSSQCKNVLASGSKRAEPVLVSSSEVSVQSISDTSEEKSVVELGTGGHKGNTTVIGTHGGRIALCEHKNV